MKTHIIWLAVVIVALFTGTRLTKPEVRTIEKPVEVIREVVKVVPKDIERVVERTVEVPAEIPEHYKTALNVFEKLKTAKSVTSKAALAGTTSVRVAIILADDIKKIISESEIRTKFEITLRRSGIPINEESRYELSYTQDGFTRGESTLKYSFTTELLETAYGVRETGQMIGVSVATWRHGNYGIIGMTMARDALLTQAEQAAEAFANEWLAMNPKK